MRSHPDPNLPVVAPDEHENTADWSGQCKRPIRPIVRTTSCPECGARAGMPCINGQHVTRQREGIVEPRTMRVPTAKIWQQKRRDPNKPPKLVSRPHYFHAVHDGRFRRYHGQTPKTSEREAIRQLEEGISGRGWVRPRHQKHLDVACPKCGAPADWPCTIEGLDWAYVSSRTPISTGQLIQHRVHAARQHAYEASVPARNKRSKRQERAPNGNTRKRS